MAGRRVHFVMSEELLVRMDEVALVLGVSRGELVRRAVERALGECGETEDTGVPIRSTSASPDPVIPAPAKQPRTVADLDSVLRAAYKGPLGPAAEHAPAKQPLSRADAFRRATQKP